MYKSLVRPILEYCSVIWFPVYKTDAIEIEKVQRRATKLIPDIRELSYPERLKKLNITTLAYRRQRTDILQVFRIIKQIDRIPIDSFFEFNQTSTWGHSYQLTKPRAETRIRHNSLSHRIINIWNNLSEEAVQCLDIANNTTALNSFKRALEKHWKASSLKFDFE